jgi:hypothetical protein
MGTSSGMVTSVDEQYINEHMLDLTVEEEYKD